MEYTDGLVEVISGAVARKHVVEALFVSTATVLLYDWLLILDREVEYIWRASWNYTKALYLFTRYTPFVSIALLLRNQFTVDPTPDSCRRTLQATCWISIIGMDFTEIILAIRTYAVWNKDRRVGIGLALLLGLCQIPNGIIVEKFVRNIDFIKNPFPEIYRGCAALSATKLIFVSWVLFIVIEGAVLALMIVSAMKTYRKDTSNFMNVIYVEGIRFYLYIFCVTLVNILISLLLPVEFVGVGSSIEIVLHSSLACRLVVGLREASQLSGCRSESLELPELLNNNTVMFAHTDPSSESTWIDVESRTRPSNPRLTAGGS